MSPYVVAIARIARIAEQELARRQWRPSAVVPGRAAARTRRRQSDAIGHIEVDPGLAHAVAEPEMLDAIDLTGAEPAMIGLAGFVVQKVDAVAAYQVPEDLAGQRLRIEFGGRSPVALSGSSGNVEPQHAVHLFGTQITIPMLGRGYAAISQNRRAVRHSLLKRFREGGQRRRIDLQLPQPGKRKSNVGMDERGARSVFSWGASGFRLV